MKIGPIGILEIIIILVVILIIFGPKNLPKLGTAIGKTVKNLREGLGGGKKKREAEEAAKQAEEAKTEPEELEVIDKPEPGKKAAAAQATAEKDFSTSDATAETTEPEKDKTE